MELKEVMNVMQVSGERIPSGYYKKPEVDAVLAGKDKEIAELQDTNVIIANNAVRLNNEIAELKAKLDSMTQQFSKYVVDAHNRERRLKRALWLSRAERAVAKQAYYDVLSRGVSSERGEMYDVWNNVERKCRAKAEEYK